MPSVVSLWYQGESNVGTAADVGRYADEMFALIESWRSEWHDDFPLYYVEIAPFTYFGNGRPGRRKPIPLTVKPYFGNSKPMPCKSPTPEWLSPQTSPTTCVTIIRATNAVWASALPSGPWRKTMTIRKVAFSGPKFRKMEIKGNAAIISLDYVDGGLVSRDGKPLTWFTTAGADGKFVPATATIQGDQVLVTSPDVAAPAAVRFAWDETAMPNLSNKAGLPLSPSARILIRGTCLPGLIDAFASRINPTEPKVQRVVEVNVGQDWRDILASRRLHGRAPGYAPVIWTDYGKPFKANGLAGFHQEGAKKSQLLPRPTK